MKNDRTYLLHILDAIERIESYIVEGREVFMRTPHWQDGVIRQLEVIGEASKHLSAGLRNRHPAIPWRRIAGLRDKLIHDYMGVDLAAVWEIASQHIPELKRSVTRMLADEEGRPG